MKPREYDANHRQLSAQRITGGQTPLARLSSASIFATEDALVRITRNVKGELRLANLGAEAAKVPIIQTIGTTKALRGTDLNALFMDTGQLEIVFDDTATLDAALRLLHGQFSRVERIVKYLAHTPAMNKCCVLTTLLAAKFWATPKMNAQRLGDWAYAFGIGDETSEYQFDFLFARAQSGKPSAIDNVYLRSSSKAIADGLFRNGSSKPETFSSLQNHCDTWDAICGSDNLLRERELLTGATVRLTPIKSDGLSVYCEVSMPFKLRPGKKIMIFGGIFPSGLPLKLAKLDFDRASGKLIAKIDRPTKMNGEPRNHKKQELDGFRFLTDPAQMNSECFAINAPFLSSAFIKAKPGTAREVKAKRDVPLHVSLAASADE
jgi:hypothetical protein